MRVKLCQKHGDATDHMFAQSRANRKIICVSCEKIATPKEKALIRGKCIRFDTVELPYEFVQTKKKENKRTDDDDDDTYFYEQFVITT